ncbi:hypothetical protein RFW18_11520 [Metabacillus idriensis]|uniref:YqgU-like beta propeller domain-containing protein n=1 Tax=Metabacillus idriensis TaxID=324768 RepID=UPI0028144F2B|nr:hypothetical protein [Metabacillus idriensis]MDR0138372.1 hypothetical protein [Metabacillus idriensis]
MRFRITLLAFITAIIFTGCSQQSHQPHDVSELAEIRKPATVERYISVDFLEEKNLIPISDENFFSVEGWLDNQHILYLSENAEKSTVYKYNLFTGEKEKVFESAASIVQLELNPDKNLILVHSSPSSFEAEITIIDQMGNVKTKRSIPSSELTFSWSPSGERLFLTSFDENWTFQTFILNMSDFSLDKNPVEIPFIQWMSDEDVTYLKWDEAEPQLTAPLYKHSLVSKKEVLIDEHIITHANFKDLSFAVVVENEEEPIGSYTFYDGNYENYIYSFDEELLPLYSEWLVPEFDYSSRSGLFYTFVPAEDNKFHLTAVDPKNKKTEIVLKNIDNSEIKLSPNGELALYGSYLEKVINLKDSEIKSIVK